MLRCSWLCAAILLPSTVPAQDPPPPPGGFAITAVPDLPVTWSDGYQSLLDVYEPAVAPPATGWPGVLALHGGSGHRRIPRIVAIATYLAARGYVVYAYDIREEGQTPALNPGWPTPRTEERLLLDEAEIHGIVQGLVPGMVDGARLAITGTSLGGNLSLKAAAFSGLPLPLGGYVTVHPTMLAAAPSIASVDSVGANVPGGLLVGDELVDGRPPTDPVVQMLDVEDYAGILGWAQGSLNAQALQNLQTSTVPLFVMLAWQDRKHQPNASTTALAALSQPRRLLLGTGGHSTPDSPHEELVENELRRRWFDRYLKGVANGVELSPYAELAVEPDAPAYGNPNAIWEHRNASAWPPPASGTTFYLRGNQSLVPVPPGGIESGPVLSHTVASGFTPAAYVAQGAGSAPNLLFTQIPKRTLSWQTAPVPTDVELFGRGEVVLEVDDTTGVFQISAVLEHVDPAGNTHPITIGTGGQRSGVAGRQQLSFAFADIAHAVPAGHRLRLVLQNVADHVGPSSRRIRYVPYFTPTDTQILMEPGFVSHIALPLRPYQANLRPRMAEASAAPGIDHGLSLRGGLARAGQIYLAASGVSGAWPATPLAAGIDVPLVVDGWTLLALPAAGGVNFPGFLGVLDANGDATMAMRFAPPLAAVLVGHEFTFAGVTLSAAGFDAAFGPATLVVDP